METSVGGVLCCTLCCTPSLVLFPSSVAHPLCSAFLQRNFHSFISAQIFLLAFFFFCLFGWVCVCVCVCPVGFCTVWAAHWPCNQAPPPPKKQQMDRKLNQVDSSSLYGIKIICDYVESWRHSADFLSLSSCCVTDGAPFRSLKSSWIFPLLHEFVFLLTIQFLVHALSIVFFLQTSYSFISFHGDVCVSVCVCVCVCMRVIKGLRVKECGCVISSLCFLLCIFEDCMCTRPVSQVSFSDLRWRLLPPRPALSRFFWPLSRRLRLYYTFSKTWANSNWCKDDKWRNSPVTQACGASKR